jgi:Leucine-rich repeat (LRR) protein
LKVLHLRYSNLTTLPASSKNFKYLEQISLKGNYQLDLASAFSLLSKIQSLRTLDLSFSKIDKLPDEFGEMQNLENIYLGNWKWCCPMVDFSGETPYNNIHELPKSVSKMKNLKNLYLWTWEVTDKEKEKMKTLIPNVNIEFDSKRPEMDLELIEEEK